MGANAPQPLVSLLATKLQTPSRTGNLVMAPGIIMTPGMSDDAMRGMATVDPATVASTAPAAARGDQPLPAAIEGG
jgi:hypothetical protein